MSKLISKHTTTLGCQVTVMDRTTPHDKMTHHEVILETAANNQVIPITLKKGEWNDDKVGM